MKNFERVAEALGVDAVDAAYLLNTVLAGKGKRSTAAQKVFGTMSPCAFCKKWHMPDREENTGNACINYYNPLNICRANMLKWLNEEEKA